ncbi:hypothetical protein DFP72DRAFT_1128882 [Ephemerocybe angulata]|uniref:Uncharacterized protein n=1 Tax=Ephemerocybe angulata TaxID=980116 RepID=A0A8H6M2V6_9AGAR|nr:hypothetical protein DFP72DRAFT_1128882 [Tulosesus angulatus]
MAQAIFEEHPLEQYLRGPSPRFWARLLEPALAYHSTIVPHRIDAGEVYELMPGTTLQLVQELDVDSHLYADSQEATEDMEWRPQCLIVGLNALEMFLASAKPSSPRNPFVERFKYTVISSSLLSSSISSPQTPRPSLTSLPGRLPHSRSTSLELDAKSDTAVFSYTDSSSNGFGLVSTAALATAFFAAVGNRFFATLGLGSLSFVLYHLITSSESPSHDFTPTFTALEELTIANAAWESTVQDAVQALESQEVTTPAMTSNSLRVSLHTTLQATRTQCDNVRQLFSALTSPAELSQLSEMYAPPSPIKSPLSLVETSPRPWSFPSRQQNPTTPQNKRSTWHASYAGLASAGSPTSNTRRRDSKRRSNVTTLFPQDSASAPVTPAALSPLPVYSLSQIAEDIKASSEGGSESASDAFGPAALGLQRERQVDGFATLSPPAAAPAARPAPLSRLDLRLATARHPLSLFTLTQTLQGAIAAKRYTCAHLLALRFGEDEEEYWENVRSMMELLTSTFADEAARLAEALEDVEREHLRDQNPTPDVGVDTFEDAERRRRLASHDRIASFAPMPTHLSRFAAHVAAITSALDDAREHLQECVDSLKDKSPQPSPMRSLGRRRMTLLDGRPEHAKEDGEEEEHKAILAYDRLRRELGMALRECERGKQKLVDILHPPPEVSSDEESDGVPGLGHDASDDSDKPDPASPSEDECEGARAEAVTVLDAGVLLPDGLDDVTSHLLRETSIQHLPPQGIEQVYEADTSNVAPFTRERSKMSREERIRMMKVRREAAASHGISMTGSSGDSADGLGLFQEPRKGGKIEKWGPGGEVVQELKDVIWKVGEKRRRMQEMQMQMQSQVPQKVRLEEREEEEELDLPPLPESPSPASPASLAFDGIPVLTSS